MASISFITPELKRLEQISAKVLVLFHFAELEPLLGFASLVDWRLYGHLSRLMIIDFLKGEYKESMLMPLGRHLPQDYLLVLGLGARQYFCKEVFLETSEKMFNTVHHLDRRNIVLTLPGRGDGECDTTTAMEWFLSSYEEHADNQEIQIIESPGAQKAMMPVVERWRLKQLVP